MRCALRGHLRRGRMEERSQREWKMGEKKKSNKGRTKIEKRGEDRLVVLHLLLLNNVGKCFPTTCHM